MNISLERPNGAPPTTSNGLPRVAMQYVPPEQANDWLALNVRNRNIKPRRVEAMARDMLHDNWSLSTNVIAFDLDGILLNGQHTLMAIVKSGVGQWLIVARDWPREAQDTMDAGVARSFADALAIAGHRNVNTLATAVRGVWTYTRRGNLIPAGSFDTPTISECQATLDEHPDIPEWCASKSPVTGMPAGAYSAGLYLFSRADTDDAEMFDSLLRTGSGLEEGNPILTLRERLIKDRSRVHPELKSMTKMAFLVRTWNAWRSGEALMKLQFKPGGAKPDRLPLIDGCPIVPESRR